MNQKNKINPAFSLILDSCFMIQCMHYTILNQHESRYKANLLAYLSKKIAEPLAMIQHKPF